MPDSRLLAAALLLFASFGGPARAADPPCDVYLLAGQSNMDGRGKAADLNDVQRRCPEGARIFYRNPPAASEGWQPLAPGYKGKLPSPTFGPEIGFAQGMAPATAGRRLALIKGSKGGTSLSAVVPHVAFASAEGLKTWDGGTHFDATSQLALGECLAAAMRKPVLPTLFIIGDSTVNNGTRGQQGWGTPIAGLFDPEKIRVVNRARGGRSSRTYLTEGLWDKVLAEMQPGDFVLMQFGHNDGGPLTGGRGRASIKGNGEETQEVTAGDKKETVHTYGWYLRKYIADAKAKGATPIVLSPVPRNMWKGDKVNRASGDYGKWAAEAAQAGGALFIDLNALVAKRYDEAGPQKVAELYFGPTDHTHTTPAGALLNAECVVEGIRGLKGCPLAGCLK